MFFEVNKAMIIILWAIGGLCSTGVAIFCLWHSRQSGFEVVTTLSASSGVRLFAKYHLLTWAILAAICFSTVGTGIILLHFRPAQVTVAEFPAVFKRLSLDSRFKFSFVDCQDLCIYVYKHPLAQGQNRSQDDSSAVIDCVAVCTTGCSESSGHSSFKSEYGFIVALREDCFGAFESLPEMCKNVYGIERDAVFFVK